MADALVLRVLGPVRVTGATGPLTTQQLSVVTYLACVGPARRETLVEAVWGGQPISDARFANVISDVRRVIGRHHLPAMVANHYRLVDVTTDLDLLGAVGRDHGVGRDDRTVDDTCGVPGGGTGETDRTAAGLLAELEALEATMGLVRGPVFGVPAHRSWWWLDGHPEVVAQAEAAVGQVAHRLVLILWHHGRLDRAREVCEHALSCCPLDRELVLALEGLHRAQGRPAAANRLITSWRAQVRRLTGEDPWRPRTPAGLQSAAVAGQASIGTAVTTTLPR